jgi:hypothetical protein
MAVPTLTVRLNRSPPFGEPAAPELRNIGEENHALDETGDFLRNLPKEGIRREWDSSAFAKASAGSHRVGDAIPP